MRKRIDGLQYIRKTEERKIKCLEYSTNSLFATIGFSLYVLHFYSNEEVPTLSAIPLEEVSNLVWLKNGIKELSINV